MITGLVLAILPLIVTALEHYNEGLKPLKDFAKYKILVRELVVDLGTQRALFRNTLEKLLCGSVASDVKLALLLEHPGGEEWQDQVLTTNLQRRLQGSYSVYMESVRDIEDLVNTLRDSIGLDVVGLPGWIDARGHKKAWKKFVMCLSRKEHEALLSRMDKPNRNLKNLTKDSLDLEPVRLSRRKGLEPFRQIRDCARSLHKALKRGWSCTCKYPHSANLRLEVRDCTSTPSFRVLFPSAGEASSNQSRTSIWQETDFRPVEYDNADSRKDEVQDPVEVGSRLASGLASLTVAASKTQMAIMSSSVQLSIGMPLVEHINMAFAPKTKVTYPKKKVGWAPETPEGKDCHQVAQRYPPDPDPTNSHPSTSSVRVRQSLIPNLCYALEQTGSIEQHETCLGCLADDELSLGVYTIHLKPTSPRSGTTTLHDLLNRDSSERQDQSHLVGTGSEQPALYVTKKQRLQIAVTLASTALQLQTTEWLSSGWGKKDILFHNGSAEYHFVSKVFPKSSPEAELPNSKAQHASFSPVRNQSIFKLGVLLLELSYGKPLDHFQTADDPPYFTEYAIAKRLVEELSEEEASGYVDATRACIFCDFGSKVKVPSFDNEAFRQAVYDDVVVPLEDQWKYGIGIRDHDTVTTANRKLILKISAFKSPATPYDKTGGKTQPVIPMNFKLAFI